MPSRIDTAVHTKVFDYPVAGHWGGGGGEMFSPARTRTDNTSAHIINDISSCLGEAKYKLYADDTVVYTDCPPRSNNGSSATNRTEQSNYMVQREPINSQH